MPTVQMKLKPFQTPNYASVELPSAPKQCGVAELPTIPIKDLEHEALVELAECWLTEVFRKANRPNPFSYTRSK